MEKSYTLTELLFIAIKDQTEDSSRPWTFCDCHDCGGVASFINWLKLQEAGGKK